MFEWLSAPIFVSVVLAAIGLAVGYRERKKQEKRELQSKSLLVYDEIAQHRRLIPAFLRSPEEVGGFPVLGGTPYETKEWDAAKGRLVQLLPQEESATLIEYYRSLPFLEGLEKDFDRGEEKFSRNDLYRAAAPIKKLCEASIECLEQYPPEDQIERIKSRTDGYDPGRKPLQRREGLPEGADKDIPRKRTPRNRKKDE